MARSTVTPLSQLAWLRANYALFVKTPDDLVAHERDFPLGAGVYLLFDAESRLLYIGKTDNFNIRCAQHIWAGKIPFKSAMLIEVDTPFEFDQMAKCVERAYIQALEPLMNHRLTGGFDVRGMPEAIRDAWAPFLDA